MVLLLIGLETACLASRFGLELLGANVTDPVVKLIYGLSSLPGTLSDQTTAASQFDLAALIWMGLGVALWYGAMRRFPLLPRIFPAPAKG